MAPCPRVRVQVDLDTNPPPGFVSKYDTKLQAQYTGNEVDIFYQVLKARCVLLASVTTTPSGRIPGLA